jgi:hypothetical protein
MVKPMPEPEQWKKARDDESFAAMLFHKYQAKRLEAWRDVMVSKEIIEKHGLVMPWEREQNGGCDASELCSGCVVLCGGGCVPVEHDELRRGD